jgi:hypothetical protein
MPSEIKGSSNFDSDSAGKVLQVVQTVKTSYSTSTSTSWADIPGMSVSITPTSTSSKIYVMVSISLSSNDTALQAKLMRNSTDILLGDAAGSRTRTSTSVYGKNAEGESAYHAAPSLAINYLDSPSTTSATTYKMSWRGEGGGNFKAINGVAYATDSSFRTRTASTITLMEIGA